MLAEGLQNLATGSEPNMTWRFVECADLWVGTLRRPDTKTKAYRCGALKVGPTLQYLFRFDPGIRACQLN